MKNIDPLIIKQIKISLANSYTRHGCNIKGDLLIFEYWDACRVYSHNTRLGGFAQGNQFDFIELIKTKLKELEIKGETKLSIPDFVYKLTNSTSINMEALLLAFHKI